MTHSEIYQQLPDYALGLLSPVQANEIAAHLEGCPACRAAVLNERHIGELVRATLSATTRPDPAHLHRLMPPVPQQTRRSVLGTYWTRRLAPALVVLALVLGSFFLSAPQTKRSMSLFDVATATATSTNTPTATIAQQNVSAGSQAPVNTGAKKMMTKDAVLESPAPLMAAPVPPQSPTPVAAVSEIAAN